MFVDYDTGEPPGRDHPWSFALSNPDERYVDFKLHPEQIPVSLPDFRPWAHYPAIQTFYALLAWLNGPESVLESNDCGLRPPRRDNETPPTIRGAFEADPIVIHARLTIIFRDLARNTSLRSIDGLKKSIHDCLRDNVPFIPAVISVGSWAHSFTAIQKEGRAVTLVCWAWGVDEVMAMVQLNNTFGAIDACLKRISERLRLGQD